jgi:hypothetical protein
MTRAARRFKPLARPPPICREPPMPRTLQEQSPARMCRFTARRPPKSRAIQAGAWRRPEEARLDHGMPRKNPCLPIDGHIFP